MIVIDKLDNIIQWAQQVYPWLTDVITAITWDSFTYLFPVSLAAMFSVLADAFLVFVTVGLFKKLFVLLS